MTTGHLSFAIRNLADPRERGGPTQRYCVKEQVRMGRVAVVAGCWFALWMALGSLVGGLTAGGHGGVQNGIYFGLFHGAWLATLTSFSWPWIMPESIARWMDGPRAET
jgi:hypothetical protein